MYLIIIILALVYLFTINWKIALAISAIVFCLDRVIDKYRNELEKKIRK